MTLAENLLQDRELLVFIGVENHSTPYHPLLFSLIWNIPKEVPSNDILIIPIKGLSEPYKISNEKVLCNGKALLILFVQSNVLLHYAILFDSFAQTDENTYFSSSCLTFLKKSNCRSVTICDMSVYKSRSLVNLLNTSISSLACSNIVVNLLTVLGYNSRGATDIETEDEILIYTKEFYLQSDIDATVLNGNFNFLRVDRMFKLPDFYKICSMVKNPAEVKLQEIKKNASALEQILKPLWDADFFRVFIKGLNKGDSFDFESLNKELLKMGFKGDLIDIKWASTYDRLCNNIRNSSKENRGDNVQKLISAIGNNINSTFSYIKSI
jgi:hypothetical protein